MPDRRLSCPEPEPHARGFRTGMSSHWSLAPAPKGRLLYTARICKDPVARWLALQTDALVRRVQLTAGKRQCLYLTQGANRALAVAGSTRMAVRDHELTASVAVQRNKNADHTSLPSRPLAGCCQLDRHTAYAHTPSNQVWLSVWQVGQYVCLIEAIHEAQDVLCCAFLLV